MTLLFVRPTLGLAQLVSRIRSDRDRRAGERDGVVTAALSRLDGLFDLGIVDGLVNLVGVVTYALGVWSRALQTGQMRSYLMLLAVVVVDLVRRDVRWIRWGDRDT